MEVVDEIVVCGDVVGYGPNPNECCEVVRTLECPVLAGNHDWAVAGLTDYQDTFSEAARKGIDFTLKVISDDNLNWLGSLPLKHRIHELEFVHSSIIHPEKWLYLMLGTPFEESPWQDVRENFQRLQGQICFVGHSHIPAIFLEKKLNTIKVIEPNDPSYLFQGKRAIVDCGSIGQPRTKSKKASLVFYQRERQLLSYERFVI